MPRHASERPPLRSLLDRLIDEQPDVSREAPPSARELERDLRRSVRRDVENLLNSRRRCITWPTELRGLDTSLVNYGIPDITGRNLATSKARASFFQSIETVLRRFEPRFKSVEIKPIESADPIERTLHFQINALVHADPEPEYVVFDSMVEPVQRSFEVKL